MHSIGVLWTLREVEASWISAFLRCCDFSAEGRQTVAWHVLENRAGPQRGLKSLQRRVSIMSLVGIVVMVLGR